MIARDDWETPKKLWDKLHKQYKFRFDCCASEENTKCFNWTQDFFSRPIVEGVAWMNPPFSKASDMFEHFFKTVSRGVAIYRCDNMETKVWQMILKKASWIHVFDKRICYEGHEGKGARFPSSLIGLNVAPPKNIKGVTIHKLNEVK